jgi:hypothetical protein
MNYKELKAVHITNINEDITKALNYAENDDFYNPLNDGTVVNTNKIIDFVINNIKNLADNTIMSRKQIKAIILNRHDLFVVLKDILRKYLNGAYFYVPLKNTECLEITKRLFLKNEYIINYCSAYNGIVFTNNGNIILNGKLVNKQRYTPLSNDNIDIINKTIANFRTSLSFHEITYETSPNREVQSLLQIVNNTIIGMFETQNKSKDPLKDCCVCFNEIKKKITLIPCGHTTICELCFGKINNVCPICKAVVTGKMYIY